MNFSIKQKLMIITGGLIMMYGLTFVLVLYLIGYIKDEFQHYKELAYKGEVLIKKLQDLKIAIQKFESNTGWKLSVQ